EGEKEKEPQSARVFTVDKDGKPAPIRVKTGISDGTHTLLVEGSLKQGDDVVIAETRKTQNTSGGASPPGMGGFR
ncbi:MAG: Efflux transporter periplasmic adaptor subunit, partial [Actinobacteria bacterium]|nr:Efflux transporter periplasmic adaptor subunit [Actinomycetota bacterium]